MSSGNFLDQFQLSMDKLNESRRKIQESVEVNNQFTNLLKDKLAQITSRLRDFAGQIQKLKETASLLQTEVNTNTASVGDKERQIQELNQRMAQAQQERDNAVAAATEEKRNLQSKIDSIQSKIDQDEEQIRELNAQLTQANDALKLVTEQKNALDNELRGKGDVAQQHANEINKLTQQAQQAAQQKEQEFKQREQELTARITDYDNKIQGFEQQIQAKDAEIARLSSEHDATKGNATNQANALQEQINQLTKRNDMLTERIIQATQAISEAAEQLTLFASGIKQARSEQDLNQMLTEIEQSLELIGRAIQGQTATAPLVRAAASPNANISVFDSSLGRQVDVPFGKIMQEISQKAKIRGTQGEKYRAALEKLNNMSANENVEQILKDNTITFKNGAISGGRVTKKNRKQKGGFTYKSTSRRRSISSTPKSIRHTSRRSSR